MCFFSRLFYEQVSFEAGQPGEVLHIICTLVLSTWFLQFSFEHGVKTREYLIISKI